MDKRFFFITTYDDYTGQTIANLLNEFPEIKCHWIPSTPLIHQSPLDKLKLSDKLVDSFIAFHQQDDGRLHGNAGGFNAFELQHRMLVEKTAHPFKTVKIALSPKTRISLLINDWLTHFGSPADALTKIESSCNELLKAKHPLYDLYNFQYFLNKVSEIAETQSIDIKHPSNKLFIIALTLVLTLDSADLPTTSKAYCFEKLVSDENIFASFLSTLSENKSLLPQNPDALKEKLEIAASKIKKWESNEWASWQVNLLTTVINARFETIYYPHIAKSLAYFYSQLGYQLSNSTKHQTKRPISKLISIQLNSNRPAQLSMYFDNIEETCDNPSDIEVIVNIDTNDTNMMSLLNKEIIKRKFTIKYCATERPASFCDLWKPINTILKLTDPGAYFLLNISDEMLFATQGWDTILWKYVGFFPDDIFRLRASRNKFRNYFDRWECSFAQDSIPITTKKWVDIGGDWNPCFGPDSFQQLVSFYLAKEGRFSNENYLRELPIIDIKLHGDIPALGIDRKKTWTHFRDHIKAMLICQSYAMQLEAKKRAILLKLNIYAANIQLDEHIILDNKKSKKLSLKSALSGEIIKTYSYKINPVAIFLTNQIRKLRYFSYFGDGAEKKQFIILSFAKYLKSRYASFQSLYEDLYCFKDGLKKLIKPFVPFYLIKKTKR